MREGIPTSACVLVTELVAVEANRELIARLRERFAVDFLRGVSQLCPTLLATRMSTSPLTLTAKPWRGARRILMGTAPVWGHLPGICLRRARIATNGFLIHARALRDFVLRGAAHQQRCDGDW